MFKKVQLKLFAVITAILIAIFVGVLISINIIMNVITNRQTNVVLQEVATGTEYNETTSMFTYLSPEQRRMDVPEKIPEDKPVTSDVRSSEVPENGEFFDKKPIRPPTDDINRKKTGEPVPRSFGAIGFFLIMADNDGKYVASLNNDDITEETAQGYIDSIINKKNKSGIKGNISYFSEKKTNGTLIVLTDRTLEMDMKKKLRRTTAVVGIASIILLSAATYFLSGFIVQPLKATFEKQKQFISDASHELKTPLTIISANADVLSGEIGENKWLNHIQNQANRMNVLVNELLNLTRLENADREFITTEFNLSKAVENVFLSFECQAFEGGLNYVMNIDENIRIVGSEPHIKQAVGILIDNALKYSKERGTVRVSLAKEDGKIVLSVYNTGKGVRAEEEDKLFERFYRGDESRNSATGGYGLGLAIAKSIVDKHKFKIQVENNEGWSICFKIII